MENCTEREGNEFLATGALTLLLDISTLDVCKYLRPTALPVHWTLLQNYIYISNEQCSYWIMKGSLISHKTGWEYSTIFRKQWFLDIDVFRASLLPYALVKIIRSRIASMQI